MVDSQPNFPQCTSLWLSPAELKAHHRAFRTAMFNPNGLLS